MTECQGACQIIPDCSFFQFDIEENVCKLHSNVIVNRVCDIVHGTAEPNFQTCFDNGEIAWAGEGMFLYFQNF